MKLLIVSHTPHVCSQGRWFGWGPPVREINFLSDYFTITHIAPQHNAINIEPSYDKVNKLIKLVPTRNRGGRELSSKVKVIIDSFHYAYLIIQEIIKSDIVHVRCPANISLVALVILFFFPQKKKWIKYAGDWRPIHDYTSYKVQRFFIRHLLSHHVVSINGKYPNEKKFIHHVLNPSYFRSEISTEIRISKSLSEGIVILFVGGLTANKGADIVVRMLDKLMVYRKDVRLYILGNGPEEEMLKKLVASLNLRPFVSFEGWKDKEALKTFYNKAHFIVLPSTGEGWPKVISEAMAFGVVPIASNVSGIKQTLDAIRAGVVVNDFDPVNYAMAIEKYFESPQEWERQSKAAVNGADQFTFEVWSEKLFALFEKRWNLDRGLIKRS